MTSLLSPHTTLRSTRIFSAAQSVLVVVLLLLLGSPLRADLADDYLAGLRQRGWHDVALEYLDDAAQDPLASPAFLKKLAYEQATTQAALAKQTAGEKQRKALLSAAVAGFQQFAKTHADSPLQIQALATAGNLLSEQATQAINKANKLPLTGQQREQLQATARDFLEQAKRPLQTLQESCQTKLKTIPKATELQNNPQAKAFQQQLLAKQAEAKFLLAKLDFEKARTQASNSKAQNKTLKIAAKAFAKLYEEYDEKLVGFYGRFYEGRCYQTAGNISKALKCYWDLVDEPPIPNQNFRRLVARAYRHRAECHLVNNDLELVIKECSEWLQDSRGPELSEPDWLAVSYQLANAYEAQAANASGTDASRLHTEARKIYREIAKIPGEFQRDARAKIVSSNGKLGKQVVVKTFDEAFAAGKEALEQMNSAKLAARLAKENNPASVESLSEQAASYQVAAKQYFRQATVLADEQTDQEQLVTARYYLCWLLWEEGRHHEAAVIGEFIARRHPENKFAPIAAKLTLAAYERLYNAAKQAGDPAKFEAQQLADIAELLIQRWPQSDEAATGLNLLMNIALRDHRLADAEKLLAQLPTTSRAAAELRLGGVLWTRYLQSQKNPNNADPAAAELEQKAGQLLAGGFKTLQTKSRATSAEATGLLYYAQLLLARGEAAQAVQVLENPKVGPLQLIANPPSPAPSAGFAQETYKIALRAYVSTQPPQREKAQEMMASLESAIGDQGNSQQKLINIYVGLGLQLQQQISALSDSGQTAKAKAVAAAFEDLLKRVTERAGSADSWKVQSWIAQTNLQLGQGLRGAAATRYHEQATQAYQTLLSKADKDPNFAPSPIAILAARKRLADSLQAQKKYAEAFQSYAALLRDKPNMIELQQAAATALQNWGTEQKDAAKIEESIRGAMPQANRKNLVWGWLRLAAIVEQAKRKAEKKASQNPAQSQRVTKYQNLFFEARLNAAQARFAAATLATGAKRKKQLQTARQSLRSMQRLYPELGGPRWQMAYEQLLKKMEQEK